MTTRRSLIHTNILHLLFAIEHLMLIGNPAFEAIILLEKSRNRLTDQAS
jgi:hypothetical protein